VPHARATRKGERMATATIKFTFEIPAEREEFREAASWQEMALATWEAKQKLFREIDENDREHNWTQIQIEFLKELMEILQWDK
jgi:hypothetical protein